MSSETSSIPTVVVEEFADLRESPSRWVFLVGSRPVVGVGLFVGFLLVFYGIWWRGLVRLRNPTAILYILSSLAESRC